MKAKFLALAALILGMVSCQTNFVDGVEVDANGEAAVTLQVGLPEDVTRAVTYGNSGIGAIGNLNLASDWDIRYILEVYDSNGTLAKERKINREDASTKTTFSLRLIPGRKYRFVVWADFIPQAQAQDDYSDYHYNTNDIRRILFNHAQLLNDESRDAYTGYVDVDNFKSSSSIALTLKRPFAKLRVVTTDMSHLYTKLVSSTVEYTSKIYTQFNAYESKKVDGSEIPGLKKTVVYSEYDYTETGDKTLFADYLFGSEDDRVMFTLDVTDNTSYDIPTVNFNTNIPVKSNHLTTIKGNILTDANEITVTIEEDFEKDNIEWPSTDVEKLEYAAMFGGEVTLTEQTVTVSEGLIVRKPMTLNLDGKFLKYTGNDVLFRVKEGASLTINGTTAGGTIMTIPETLSPTGGNGYIAVVYEGCTLTIDGGNYQALSTCTIAQANGGKIYVKGGTFQAKEYDTNGVKDHRYTFNHSDSLKDVGKIEITGGMFYKWNPFESHSENPAMNFVAKGYDAYPINDDYYQVYSLEVARSQEFTTPSNCDVAFELLRTVFRNGGKVYVPERHPYAADVYVTEALIATNGVNVEIRGGGDIHLKDGVTSIYEQGVASALICAKNGAKITFNDYSGDVNGGSEDYAIETRGGSIVVNDGKFYGAVSAAYALEGTITINGGTFADNSSYNAQYLLNCYDANYNADPKKANIVVYGGTFVGFNPADNAAEGTGTNFVAAGYESTETSNVGTWKVSQQ